MTGTEAEAVVEHIVVTARRVANTRRILLLKEGREMLEPSGFSLLVIKEIINTACKTVPLWYFFTLPLVVQF